MNVLDLFSGIGGFSLGLERAGMRTVAFCEIDPYCRRVLARHWPHVPCYDDVRTLTAARLAAAGIAIDAICGGFPCQDISLAGAGAGLSGARSGLWSEYARLIGELRPRYVIVENVAALLSRGLGSVLGDLAEIGYDAEWHCISAAHAGLAHQRDRIWIVAHANGPLLERSALARRADSERQERAQQLGAMAKALVRISSPAGSSGGISYGISHRVDRLRSLGNAVVPQIPELIGRAIMKASAPQPGNTP